MAVARENRLFDEIVDFLASAPSTDELIAYQLPEHLDERLHELLDRNSNEGLTPDERDELQEFLRLDHLLTMVKLKARLRLAGKA